MCTRLLYQGPQERVITGRSMDWKGDIGTNLWVFPRGMERDGSAGERSLTWTSRYGSVIASGYDISTTDGLNEAGLCANLLWLVESAYPGTEDGRPLVSLAVWTQYVLDNFATVAEVVEDLGQERFAVFTAEMPGEERLATVHLSVSDASGDSAIFEYIDGRLVIHHDRAYQVMTNSPTFDQQLAIAAYWEEIGGTVMLPGTNRASDRFARARFYVNAVPQVEDRRASLASVFSVIRNVSVPYGISTPDQPNISSTQWRTVIDHKSRAYFFDSAMSPGVFWIDLDDVDLSPGAPVLRLDVKGLQAEGRSGSMTAELAPAEIFAFAGLTA